jgi:putative SbcD/Mre11-related phosphoesterase
MELKFVTGKPALTVGETLVIADLHIGIEYAFYRAGIKLPSQTGYLITELQGILKKTGSKEIIILGDIKHKVPGTSFQEEREIPDFFRNFRNVHVVPGNHDGDLKSLLPANIKIHSSRGFLKDGCYFTHGHTWPSRDFLEAEYVFVGHEHPQIEFKDRIGYRFVQDAWIIGALKKSIIEKRYGRSGSIPKLVMVPKFNRLSGGISMNSPISRIEMEHKKLNTGLGPLVRSANLSASQVFLLDGTHLGRLGNIK